MLVKGNGIPFDGELKGIIPLLLTMLAIEAAADIAKYLDTVVNFHSALARIRVSVRREEKRWSTTPTGSINNI